MIKEFNNQEAIVTWDDILLTFPRYNFYQSFSNSKIEGLKKRPRYFVNEKNNKINILSMCLQGENKTTIPFGPIILDNVSEIELTEYLKELTGILETDLIFSLEAIDFEKFKNLMNNSLSYWDFTTIVLDLENKSVDDVISKFNTNRKRILKRCLIELKDYIIEDSISNINDFYTLYIKRLTENGCDINFSEFYIKNIVKQKNTGVLVCKNQFDELLSGLIYYQFGDTIVTRHNAFNSKYAHLNPGTYLDFYMIKKILQDSSLMYYDMSGLATGENSTQKMLNINRYKESYGNGKILSYKWLKLDNN